MVDLARPAHPDDDGSADPDVRRCLARLEDPVLLARRLRSARLLGTVVAVADTVGEDGADKDSHMAVVSMVGADGRRGLLAFTGIDSLAAWDPTARPVPAAGRDVARAALDEGSAAVVLDVAGPHARVLEGLALVVLADQSDISTATALIQAALAPLTGDGWVNVTVESGSVHPGADDPGVDLVVVLATQGHPDGRLPTQLAQQAARILGERADLTRCVPGGVGIRLA